MRKPSRNSMRVKWATKCEQTESGSAWMENINIMIFDATF